MLMGNSVRQKEDLLEATYQEGGFVRLLAPEHTAQPTLTPSPGASGICQYVRVLAIQESLLRPSLGEYCSPSATGHAPCMPLHSCIVGHSPNGKMFLP